MPEAFVIIQIGDKDLDALCADAIFPAIRACGLEPRRVDRHNEGGLLKSEIVKFIQDCDILIADLTNERPNVYLEVGYAMGLDKFKNLILTVREDHFPESKNHKHGGPRVHFDLAGYDILRWASDETAAFKNELELRIKRRLAILRPGPKGSPVAIWEKEWFDGQRAAALEGLKALGRPGHMEVRAAVHPPKPNKNQVELNDAARNAQIETFGWPIAVYLDADGLRPKPRADGIVASVHPDTTKDSFDYWSIRRNGDFYFLGSLFEDERPKGAAGKFLYFDTRIIRVTEALLYCIRLYTALGVDRASAVSIGIRHGGLQGRLWWSASGRLIRQRRLSEEDVVDAEVTATLDSFETQLVDHVVAFCGPLFRVFDFAEVDRPTYEHIVNSFVAGKIA
jgi:hypothetical protein